MVKDAMISLRSALGTFVREYQRTCDFLPLHPALVHPGQESVSKGTMRGSSLSRVPSTSCSSSNGGGY